MKLSKGKQATILGILTSIFTALTLVDLDKLDYTLPSTWVKLLVIVLPAIGGSISSVNSRKPTDQQ